MADTDLKHHVINLYSLISRMASSLQAYQASMVACAECGNILDRGVACHGLPETTIKINNVMGWEIEEKTETITYYCQWCWQKQQFYPNKKK